jgi:integrase
VRDYKAHLVTVEHRAPATVNRRLAALRKFFAWAKGDGRVTELPTELVKGVPPAPRAPKSKRAPRHASCSPPLHDYAGRADHISSEKHAP